MNSGRMKNIGIAVDVADRADLFAKRLRIFNLRVQPVLDLVGLEFGFF